MTRTCNEMLQELLFNNDGTELINFKLQRGDSSDVSPEEICEQVHAAKIQVATGQAETFTDFPNVDKSGSINLLELESRL